MDLDLSLTYSGKRKEPATGPLRNLEVAWGSPWREFHTSLVDFFTGARPLNDSELPPDPAFRVDWVGNRLPGRAFTASSLWHVAAVLILILPIWGFLPQPEHTLAPVQIEVTYYPTQDLPRISLPAAKPKPSAPAKQSERNAKPTDAPGADAYHPRQTILSTPVQVTHPRQTLIQPDAPKTAPKIDAQLPNIVQWATPAPPRPQLQVAAASPAARQRIVHDIAIPEVANSENNPAALNIASASVVNPQPQMPMSATSVAAQRQARKDTTAAPEVGAATSDTTLHRLIALSATPGPPVPAVSVPQENLAARISISPEGKKSGTPDSSDHERERAGPGGGALTPPGAKGAGGVANASALPAAVSISGGRAGGIAPSPSTSGKLNLKPAPPDFTAPARKGPSVVGTIAPNTPPDKILYGKEVYTLDVNLPNLTSAAGSWILNFAELDENDAPPFRPRSQLSGPVPLEKMDPKYPPELIKEHVEGQVILYAIIKKDGSVGNIQVVHGIEAELDKDAMEAFARWRFRPGERDGVPVDLEAVIYIPFRYRAPE
jgi:TonB family protein